MRGTATRGAHNHQPCGRSAFGGTLEFSHHVLRVVVSVAMVSVGTIGIGCVDSGAEGTPDVVEPAPEPEPTPEPSSSDGGVDGGLDAGRDAGDDDAGAEPEPTPEGPAVEPGVEPSVEPDAADAGPIDEDGGVSPPDGGQDAGPPLPCGGCGEGETCCGETCVDLATSPDNCGACGTQCTLDEFCGGDGPGCQELSFANLCLVNTPFRIDDGETADIESGTVIADAVQSACPNMESYSIRNQSDAEVIEPGTGRPISGVNTLVMLAGGSFFQDAVRYLEAAEDVPVIAETTANTERLHRRYGGTIVDIPKAAVTPAHDFFVIQLAEEAISGTLALSSYGMFTPGTRAGAYWLATEILPNLAAFPEQFFVYEWTDSNGDEVPNAGDSFALIISG